MHNYTAKMISRRRVHSAIVAAISCLAGGTALSAVAATPPAAPAQQCLKDLKAFDASLRKDGYWLGGEGYGYGNGFPVYGYGYSYMGMGSYAESGGYSHGRPGYDVRTLLSAARVLGQSGQQATCASVLNAARLSYATYVAELRSGKVPPADVTGWRRQQIENATPVASNALAYRSDQLIGSDVINGQDQELGSVEDIVMSPTSGKIAYLVVGHGGFIGIGEKYSAVPWADFKSFLGSNLLILPVTKAAMDAAPESKADSTNLTSQSATIDAYWTAHPPVAMN